MNDPNIPRWVGLVYTTRDQLNLDWLDNNWFNLSKWELIKFGMKQHLQTTQEAQYIDKSPIF